MIQIITGVFLSQMLVGSCLVLLLTAGYKCGLTWMMPLVSSRRGSGKTSTVDHIFTLLAIVKQLSLNRELYVAFIDFQKTFDFISRKLLWPILQKQGIRGKLFCCVKSIYEVVKERVRDGASLTESIHCLHGVKQSDACSPILFSLFINELALDVIKGSKQGAILTSILGWNIYTTVCGWHSSFFWDCFWFTKSAEYIVQILWKIAT